MVEVDISKHDNIEIEVKIEILSNIEIYEDAQSPAKSDWANYITKYQNKEKLKYIKY